MLNFTNEHGEKYLDGEDEAYQDDISYGSETEIQNEAHDNEGKITGVESEVIIKMKSDFQ